MVTTEKFAGTTLITDSLNVTVHDSGPAFTVELAPARTMELTVGAAVSIVNCAVAA